MVASPALVNFLFGHPSAATTPSPVKENPGAGLPSPHSAHQPHFIAICSFQSGSQAKVLLPLSNILKQWRRSQLPSCAVADGFWAASGVLCVCPFASPSEIRTGARAAGCSVSFCFWSSAPPATPFLSWPPGSCLRRCSRQCSCYRTTRSSCPNERDGHSGASSTLDQYPPYYKPHGWRPRRPSKGATQHWDRKGSWGGGVDSLSVSVEVTTGWIGELSNRTNR